MNEKMQEETGRNKTKREGAEGNRKEQREFKRNKMKQAEAGRS